MVTTVSKFKHPLAKTKSHSCAALCDNDFRNMMFSFFESNISCGLLKVILEFNYHFIPKAILTPLHEQMGSV